MLAATGYVGDSPLFLFDVDLRFLRIVVLLSLWRIIFQNRGTVSGMTLDSVLVYAFIAEVFAEQLNCSANLEDAFWNGNVVMRYLQPMALAGQFASEMVGRWAFTFVVVSIPLYLAAPLLGVHPLPANSSAGFLFLVSLFLAVVTGFAFDFLLCAWMVCLNSGIWVLTGLRNALLTLLSGSVIPLALLPWGLGRVFDWLPFASMASAPLRIYTGTGDAGRLLALQAAWSLALGPAAIWVWRTSRERVVSFGG
jgi:ABC-type uncharacterized transport system permease subunit